MKKKTSAKPATSKTKAAGSASIKKKSASLRTVKAKEVPSSAIKTTPIKTTLTEKVVRKKASTSKSSSKNLTSEIMHPSASSLQEKLNEVPAGKSAKPVVAEIMYENVGPTPMDQEELEHDKAYAVPAEDELLEDLADETADQISEDGKGKTSKSATRGTSKSLVPSEGASGITSSDPLAIYLNDIRKYPVLTKDQEIEIAKKYFETKDPEAAQTLIKSNLRFVVKVAADYSRFGAKMIDLIQEGNVGLMHAVREYNPYKGARLITYAVWWIRGYIQEYLMRQYSMVRIGTTQNQRRLFYQLQKEKEALDAMGQEPNLKLLSSRLGIPEDEIEQMSQRMSGRDVSLDRPLDDDTGSSLMDLQRSNADMSLDDKIAHEEQLDILKQKIETLRPELSEREKIILDERILNDEPLTLQEIGEKHGITREAVRQMEARVLKKIKTKMESE